MKKTLTLGTLFLGCCLAAVAQTGSNPNQTPPMSTPSTFPQDQTGQTPSNPSTPSSPSAIPPDTSATGPTASNSQSTTIDGCLSQSSDGTFMLADNTGNTYQLRGDNSQLTGFVGQEVKVDGVPTASSSANPGSMASPSSSSNSASTSATQFSVDRAHKVAETCPSK